MSWMRKEPELEEKESTVKVHVEVERHTTVKVDVEVEQSQIAEAIALIIKKLLE